MFTYSAGLALFKGIFQFCATWNDELSPNGRQQVRQYIDVLTERPGKLLRLPEFFVEMFDRVFGQNHWSWTCFRRSCLASFTMVAFSLLLWLLNQPHDFLFTESAWRELPYLFPAIILLNLFPDYLSLLESRWVLHQMATARCWTAMVMWLIVDVVASAALFIVVGIGLMTAAKSVLAIALADYTAFEAAWRFPIWYWNQAKLLLLYGLNLKAAAGFSSGPFFYSTFFTTAFAWLFLASGLLVRLLLIVGRAIRLTSPLLDFEQRPLRAFGAVFGSMVATVIWAAATVVWVF